MHKALHSIPALQKNNVVHTCNAKIGSGRQDSEGFKNILSYITESLKLAWVMGELCLKTHTNTHTQKARSNIYLGTKSRAHLVNSTVSSNVTTFLSFTSHLKWTITNRPAENLPNPMLETFSITSFIHLICICWVYHTAGPTISKKRTAAN